MAHLDARPTGERRLRIRPLPVGQHSFVEIHHEIFSKVIFSFLPSADSRRALPVSSERMCTIIFNCLED